MSRTKVKGSGSSMSSESDRQLNAISLEYSFEELRASTDNFSVSNRVGQGAYGDVYKGVLRDGNEVAIKYLHADQQAAGFEEEVKVLSKFRHQNLVILMGFSRHGPQRLLVYELLPGGDVGSRLQKGPLLPWRQRLNIALDAACGLSHLHNQNPKVFHRDIKSANILLDRNGTAKWGDFGLACLSAKLSHKVLQTAGTVGYADPRYISTSVVTENTEVYSYGWVIIELLTAKPPAIQHRDGRISYFLSKLKDTKTGAPSLRNLLTFIDESAGFPEAVRMALAKLALRSISPDESNRPDFRSIVLELRRLVADCDVMYGHRGQDPGDRFVYTPHGAYEHSPGGHVKQLAPLIGLQQKAFNHVTPSPHGTLARSLAGHVEHRNFHIAETPLQFGPLSDEKKPQPNWHNQPRTAIGTNLTRPPYDALLPQATNPSFAPSSTGLPYDPHKAAHGQKQLSPPIYQTPRPNKVSYACGHSPQPTGSQSPSNAFGEDQKVDANFQRRAQPDSNDHQPSGSGTSDIQRLGVSEREDRAVSSRIMKPAMPTTTSSSSNSSATTLQVVSQQSEDGQVCHDNELQRKSVAPFRVSQGINVADISETCHAPPSTPASGQTPIRSRPESVLGRPHLIPEAIAPPKCSAQDSGGRPASQITFVQRYVTTPDARNVDQMAQNDSSASPRKPASTTCPQPTQVSQGPGTLVSHGITDRIVPTVVGQGSVPPVMQLLPDNRNSAVRSREQPLEKVVRSAERSCGSPLSSYRASSGQVPSGSRPAIHEASFSRMGPPDANSALGVPPPAAVRRVEERVVGSPSRLEQSTPSDRSATAAPRSTAVPESHHQKLVGESMAGGAAGRSKSAFSKHRQVCGSEAQPSEPNPEVRSMPRSRLGDNVYHHKRTRSSSRHGNENDLDALTLSQLSLNGSERSFSTPVFGIEEELEQFQRDHGPDSADDICPVARFGSATSRTADPRRPTTDLSSKMIAQLQRAKAACRGMSNSLPKGSGRETLSGQAGLRTARAYVRGGSEKSNWDAKNRSSRSSARHQTTERTLPASQARSQPLCRTPHQDHAKGVPRSELATLHSSRQGTGRTEIPVDALQNSWSDPASDSVASPQKPFQQRELAKKKIGASCSPALTERSRRHEAVRSASRSQDQASVLATSRRRCSDDQNEGSSVKPTSGSMCRVSAGSRRPAAGRPLNQNAARLVRLVDFLDSASSDMSGDIVQPAKSPADQDVASSVTSSSYSPKSNRFPSIAKKSSPVTGVTGQPRTSSEQLVEPCSAHFSQPSTVTGRSSTNTRDAHLETGARVRAPEVVHSEKFKTLAQKADPTLLPFKPSQHSLGVFSTAATFPSSPMSSGNPLMPAGLMGVEAGLEGCDTTATGAESLLGGFISGSQPERCVAKTPPSVPPRAQEIGSGFSVSPCISSENDQRTQDTQDPVSDSHQADSHEDSDSDSSSCSEVPDYQLKSQNNLSDDQDYRPSEPQPETVGGPHQISVSNPLMVSQGFEDTPVPASSILRDSYSDLPAKPWGGGPWLATSSGLDSRLYGAEPKPYGTSSTLETRPYGVGWGLEPKSYRSGLSWGACSTHSGLSLAGLSPSSMGSSVSSVFGNHSSEMNGGLCAMMTEATLSMPSCMGAPLERPLA